MGKNNLLKSKRRRNNAKAIKNKNPSQPPTEPEKTKTKTTIKSTNTSQTPKPEEKKPKPKKQKRETFMETAMRLMRETSRPINRVELVEKCIAANPPKSKRPAWVYHDIIRRLAKQAKIIIDKSKGAKRDKHIVSLA